MKKETKGQFSQRDVQLVPTTRKYTWEQKGKAIDQGFGSKSQKPSKGNPDHVVLQIDADDQGVLQVDCSKVDTVDHATFQSYVEKVMRLSQVVNGDISQER